MDEQEHGVEARPVAGARPVTLRAAGWLIAAGLLALLVTTNCVVMIPPADQIPPDPASCRDDLDCSPAELCNADLICQPKPCDGSADCTCNQPNPEVAGVCVAPAEMVSCQSGADCAADQTCDVTRANGVCVDTAALGVVTNRFNFIANGNQPIVGGRPLGLELFLVQQPGDPQVSSFTIQFPPGAVLFKPFTAGAAIGTVFNATTTSTVTLVAGNNVTAFADVNGSGTRDPGEAQLRVMADGGSVRSIFVHNPFGGDFDPNQHLATAGQSLHVVLSPTFFRAGFGGQYVLNGHLRFETGVGISQGIQLDVQPAVEPLSLDFDSAVFGPSSLSVMSGTGGRVVLGPYQVSIGASGFSSTAKIRLNMVGPGFSAPPAGAAYLAASPGSACTVLGQFLVECNFDAPGGTSTSTTGVVLANVPNAGTAFHVAEVTLDDGETAFVRGTVISQATPGTFSPYLAVLQLPEQATSSFTGNLAITSPGPVTVDADAFLFAFPPASPDSAKFGTFTTMPSTTVQAFPDPPQRSFLVTTSTGSVRVNFTVQRQSDAFSAFGITLNGGPFVDFGRAVVLGNASIAPPTITSFAPAAGAAGSEVLISGTNLAGVTEVRFNGVSAGAPVMVSATQIRVRVPAAATTGLITVIGPGFSLQSATAFKVLPKITAFSPASGIAGDLVTINGSGFTGASEVMFGGINASTFTVASSATVTAVVSSAAKTGKITVKTAGGLATSPTDFTVVKMPTIGTLTPAAAKVGDTLTIAGTDLATVTDVAFTMATGVTLTPTVASGPRRPAVAPITRSATSLSVKVPPGATTGKITVTNPAGTAQSATQFRVIPAITGFSPTAVIVGTSVSIIGTSFTGATAVRFGTINAPFTVLSDGEITAAVPPGATGMVTVAVVTAGGTATGTLQVFGVLGISTTTLVPAKANASYTQTLMTAGGRAPYTWSLFGGALPTGMNLSAAGVITGTSPTTGISSFTARVGDSLNQSATKTFDLVVNLGAFSATCVPPTGEVGVAYSQTACVPKGGLPPYTCSLASGNTSAGTTLNSDCTLSGTPTAAGTKMFTTRVADSGGAAVNVATTHMVLPAVQVTTATLLPAKANTSYTTTLMAAGGKLPYTWALVGGNISPGFTLSPAGVISGSSGVLGLRGFNVSATDALGGVATRALLLAVNLGPLAATCTPPSGEVGVPYNQPACVPRLGLPPYTCSLVSGSTAAGTTLNSDCTLSGTPTAAGPKTFMTRVADSGGSAVTVSTTHTVLPAVQVTTTALLAAKANTSYMATLMAAGGKTPYAWSVVGGSLPAGFNVSAAGIISGKSGVLGFTPFTVRATDALGGVDDQLLQLAVNLGPLAATCMPPNGEVGVAYNQAACVPKLGLPPYTCSLAGGNTSAGTTLNSDCTLSGTPTAAGAKTFMTRVADSGGLFVNMSTTHTVLPAVQVTTTTLPAAKANTSYMTTLVAAGGKTPYAWSVVGGSLPAGFNMSVAGVISGKSGVLGFTPFTVRATDALGGFDDQLLQLAVNLGPLAATCTPSNGEVGVPYNQPACVASLGLPPYTCSLAGGNTSAGTILNSDCSLSGTPTAAGAKMFTTRVADSGGSAVTVAATHMVLPAVQITTISVPAARANTSYTTTLMAAGGKTPYIWSVASGNLSAGLALAPGTGVLSGISTGLGIHDVTIRATDALGGFDDQLIRLVTNLGPLSVTCLPKLSSANASYSTTCSGTGGLPPYTCTLNSGTPPAGIGVNEDCSVTGVPTGVGSRTFSIRATDSANASATTNLTINVAAAADVATTSLPTGKVGVAYSATLQFRPSVPPYTWAIVGGTLPSNIVLNMNTGALTGTPTVAGSFPITVQVTDGAGGTGTKDLTLTINP